MNALLAAAVLSLMLPIRMETGLILVRPFEFLIALGMLGWPLIAARRGVRVPPACCSCFRISRGMSCPPRSAGRGTPCGKRCRCSS